jgi:hypothetical protein
MCAKISVFASRATWNEADAARSKVLQNQREVAMSALRNFLVLAALALVAAGSPAQDDAPGQADPAANSEPASPPAPESAPLPAPNPADDVFVPTEEIAADEEVTFPVDI